MASMLRWFLGVALLVGPAQTAAAQLPSPRTELARPYREAPAPHLGGALANPRPWYERVERCWGSGDNDCVVALLSTRPLDATRLDQLIGALRARGDVRRARLRMTEYVERFGDEPRAWRYRQLLER